MAERKLNHIKQLYKVVYVWSLPKWAKIKYFTFLAFPKWCTSRKAVYPVTRHINTQPMTIVRYPPSIPKTGKISIEPPIIALSNPTRVVKVLMVIELWYKSLLSIWENRKLLSICNSSFFLCYKKSFGVWTAAIANTAIFTYLIEYFLNKKDDTS